MIFIVLVPIMFFCAIRLICNLHEDITSGWKEGEEEAARWKSEMENKSIKNKSYSVWSFISDKDKETIKILNNWDNFPDYNYSSKAVAQYKAQDVVNELNNIRRIFSDESN